MVDLKIGDEVYIHGFVDEVRRDTVIIKNEGGYFGTVAEEIMPSAQPEPHYDEWCHDCKEYDKERHCCPRWNRVIRQALKELKDAQPEQQWISCKDRLPEVNESVLVTTEWNDISIAWRIGIDKWFIHEGNTNATTDDLAAWMPLPEPYKEKDNERA